MGEGTNNYVVTLESYQGSIYAGGEFTEAGGLSTPYIARWGAPVGLEDINSQETVRVYPNPAGNFIYYELPASNGAKDLTLTLYNELGSVVLKKQLSSIGGQGKLNIEYLKKGLYIVEIASSNSKYYHGKFVKK